MDGKQKDARYERWLARAAAAYGRMFCDKNQEELVTLTEREDMAVSLGDPKADALEMNEDELKTKIAELS